MTSSHIGRVASAILEMADDLQRVGIMDDPLHGKIALRHLGKRVLATAEPFSDDNANRVRRPPGQTD